MPTPVFYCPHCEAKAQFSLQTTTSYSVNRNEIFYNVFRCAACDALVLRTILKDQLNLPRVIGQYPTIFVAEIEEFNNSVPEDVLSDFHESLKCYEIDAYKASAAMCRRSLQAAVIERGADKDKKLIAQIDGLTIAQDIKDWAHQIRILGNWGAHPEDDQLKEVGDKLAKEIIDFVKAFFTYVYVMPNKVKNSRANTQPQVAAPNV